MKGKLWTWIILAVVVIFGIGAAGVGFKWYRWKKARATQVWEIKSPLATFKADASQEDIDKIIVSANEDIKRYEVLRPVVDELELQEYWGIEEVNEVMEQLKHRLSVRAQDGKLLFVVTDKDQEMADKLARAVLESHSRVQRLQRYGLPTMAP